MGDEVQATILKLVSDRAFGFGKLQKIIKASKNRVDSVCAVADRCGGCQLLHQTYRSGDKDFFPTRFLYIILRIISN